MKILKLIPVIVFSTIGFISPLFSAPEFLVNTYTDDDQEYSDIAMDSEGNFVITWDSEWQSKASDIYLQRYDKNGNPIGGEFLVSSGEEDGGFEPSIAMNDSGAFVITWIGGDGSTTGIKAQMFNSDGTKKGGVFLVNSFKAWYQENPDVAIDNTGNFVIT